MCCNSKLLITFCSPSHPYSILLSHINNRCFFCLCCCFRLRPPQANCLCEPFISDCFFIWLDCLGNIFRTSLAITRISISCFYEMTGRRPALTLFISTLIPDFSKFSFTLSIVSPYASLILRRPSPVKAPVRLSCCSRESTMCLAPAIFRKPTSSVFSGICFKWRSMVWLSSLTGLRLTRW